jgi:hypothetical protein
MRTQKAAVVILVENSSDSARLVLTKPEDNKEVNARRLRTRNEVPSDM